MLVLCYHKIGSLNGDWNGIVTTPTSFEQQLIWLNANYTVRSSWECSGELGERDVIITFDDGYEDNYTTALPILEKLAIPATFFISTGCLDTNREDWCNELAWLMMEGTDYPSRFHFDQCMYETKSAVQRQQLHRKLERALMTVFNWKRQEILETLCIWCNADKREKRNSYRMLSRSQLQSLSSSKYATIGIHSVNHPSLGALSREEQYYEVFESKRTVEDIIGKKAEFFAYPFGGPESYTLTTMEILKQAGFQKAFSTTYKRKTPNNFIFEIPRVCINECELEDFIQKVHHYQLKSSYWWG